MIWPLTYYSIEELKINNDHLSRQRLGDLRRLWTALIEPKWVLDDTDEGDIPVSTAEFFSTLHPKKTEPQMFVHYTGKIYPTTAFVVSPQPTVTPLLTSPPPMFSPQLTSPPPMFSPMLASPQFATSSFSSTHRAIQIDPNRLNVGRTTKTNNYYTTKEVKFFATQLSILSSGTKSQLVKRIKNKLNLM